MLVEVVVSTLSEAALVYLAEEEGRTGRKVSHLVLQGLLELLHNILRQTSAVVRSALQVHARRWLDSLTPPPTAAGSALTTVAGKRSGNSQRSVSQMQHHF